MTHERGPERTVILRLGLAALALFGGVVVLANVLGVEGLPPLNPGVPGDAAASFSRLATGDLTDPARIVELGELDPVVHESSGVAVSRAFSEVLWTHNDGGDGRLFAVRPDGTLIATVAVDGPAVQDWEDLALGPCPRDGPQDRDCLYVGDIGDNQVQRTAYGVDIIPEPDPSSDRRVTVLRRVQFVYPDGAADAEALALAPDGALRLITKGGDGTARLYRLPVDADAAPSRPELVGTLPLDVAATRDRVTGAAVSRDGTRLALRSHRAVYLFPLSEPLDAPVVCEIGMLQPQGEAIDYIQADMLILTSEATGGRSPVLRLRCP